MLEGLPELDIDPSRYTRKRVMVTTTMMKLANEDEPPRVVLAAEDGSGLIVSAMGPDIPQSRADAVRMMTLWNTALDANEALSHPAG